MSWLLDTNILSELRRPKPERRVVAFIADRPLTQLYVSTVCRNPFWDWARCRTEVARRIERLAYPQGAADV